MLRTIDITRTESFAAVTKKIKARIHLIAVDTDQLFTPDETRITYASLRAAGVKVTYNEIVSINGHDAFLIEHVQLGRILRHVFEGNYAERAKEHRV